MATDGKNGIMSVTFSFFMYYELLKGDSITMPWLVELSSLNEWLTGKMELSKELDFFSKEKFYWLIEGKLYFGQIDLSKKRLIIKKQLHLKFPVYGNNYLWLLYLIFIFQLSGTFIYIISISQSLIK